MNMSDKSIWTENFNCALQAYLPLFLFGFKSSDKTTEKDTIRMTTILMNKHGEPQGWFEKPKGNISRNNQKTRHELKRVGFLFAE